MNNLNSVIIEGSVAEPPISYEGHTTFVIESYRHKQDETKTLHEVSYFSVIAYGRLAQTCADVLKEGLGIRVVGRLKQFRDEASVAIVAEHVEFKPVKKGVKE